MSQKRRSGPTKPAFVIYPGGVTLPDPRSISIDSQLVSSYFNFSRFWRNSSYYLGDGGVSKIENEESLDIERHSDSLKPKSKKGSFYDFLLLRPDNFPKQLLGDNTPRERPVKRAKWSQDAALQKLDVFEKLEATFKAQGEEEKEQGDDDDEQVEEESQGDDDDDEQVEEESQGEESDHGDYDHNQDFDDDDDDYNQADHVEFEPLY